MPASAMCCQRPGSMLTCTPASRPASAAQVLASPRRVIRYFTMLMVLLFGCDKKNASAGAGARERHRPRDSAVGAGEPALEKTLGGRMQRRDQAIVAGDRGAGLRAERAVLRDGGAGRAERPLQRAMHGLHADVDADIEDLGADRGGKLRPAVALPPVAAIDLRRLLRCQRADAGGAELRIGAQRDAVVGDPAGIGGVVDQAALMRQHGRDRAVERRVVAHEALPIRSARVATRLAMPRIVLPAAASTMTSSRVTRCAVSRSIARMFA